MSEDEEEIEQRESWKANQQRLKEMERDDNEADFEIENISRNDSIAINLINEEQSKRDREKAHLEKKQMQLEKLKKKEEEEKDFIETVENIIANLQFCNKILNICVKVKFIDFKAFTNSINFSNKAFLNSF
jgi:polysaccharide pyruvyl transferase WcaK-like protein